MEEQTITENVIPNSRQRLLTALSHQEPDRIPLDLGSTQVTGIHAVAYRNLRSVFGLPTVDVKFSDSIQQLSSPDQDLITKLGVDVRGLFPLNSHNWQIKEEDGSDYWMYHDEWGITHRRPKPDGLYYSIFQVPIPADQLSVDRIEAFKWPDFSDPKRISGLVELAHKYRAAGYAVVIKDPFAGIFEMSQRIIDMQSLMVMMAEDPDRACLLFDKMVELKLSFWEMALPKLASLVDVIAQMDDYGTQNSQLISPRMFRKLMKPRWKIILDRIHQLAPQAKCFFHSCGNVRPIIPDFIEIGVDILNPIHVRAAGMNPLTLKQDFDKELVFWGGGVDTQGVLPYGSPQEVAEDVKRNIDIFAPGGGYVFSPVHNIQADVPAQNLESMFRTLQEYNISIETGRQ